MGMKLTCIQENLAKGLNIVSAAVGSRSTLPVLSNVLLTTDNGRLRISGTDTNLGIKVWIGASVDEDGAITVPARTLRELVNTLSPERVDLEAVVRTQTLNLMCGSTSAQIKGIDAAEFPIMPEPTDDDDVIAIPADVLADSIRMVAFAAARDDTRPILTGVLIAYEDGILTMAAADSFRLAVREVPIETDFMRSFQIVVPAKALQEVERIISDEDDMVYMAISREDNHVIFSMKDVDLDSRTIDGTFPDFQAIIPRETPTTTVVHTSDLLRAVTRAEIFARQANNLVRVSVEPQDGMAGVLRIRATSNETGENEGIIDASVEGDSMEIAFNARYLMEMLKVMPQEKVVLGVSQADKPGLFKAVDDSTYSHVVMPMHFNP